MGSGRSEPNQGDFSFLPGSRMGLGLPRKSSRVCSFLGKRFQGWVGLAESKQGRSLAAGKLGCAPKLGSQHSSGQSQFPSLPLFPGISSAGASVQREGSWAHPLWQKPESPQGSAGLGLLLLKKLLSVLKDVWRKGTWQNHNRAVQGERKGRINPHN